MSDLKHWLAATFINKIGPVGLKNLLEEHGSIEKVCAEINPPFDLAENQIYLAEKFAAKIISQVDASYPELLKNIYDPPIVLFVKGEPETLKTKSIGIVGTRRASRYGLEIARKLAFDLASLGITVVSGLASGIDTAAHQGALEAKGKTIAVFGCGLDTIFPAANRGLAKEIEGNGALVSEYAFGSLTSKASFPRRNRIISGLSLGTIVIEGDYKSGAMITAKCALDQGREVFAVPGDVRLEQSNGPHWLIKQGAKLVENVGDVVEEFGMVMPEKMSNDKLKMSNEGRIDLNLSDDEKRVVAALSLEPKHLDIICFETGFSLQQISSLLLALEMKKAIKQLPGKVFVLL